MAFKFAFMVVLCVVQANPSAPKNNNEGTGEDPTGIESPELSLPIELEKTMQDMDDVRETVSMAAMDAYVEGNNPEVIIACFNQQRGPYMKLGKKIAGMVKEASDKMAEELGEEYRKYAERAEAPLRNIGMTMKILPQKMWMLIRDGKFRVALEVMRQSRKVVEENSKILAQIMREMAEEVPEAAQKAEEMASEIREVSRKGCQEIEEAFRKCVEEGGPKKPIEEVDTDEEETENQ